MHNRLITEFRLVRNSNFDCKFISVRKSIMYAYLCFPTAFSSEAFPKHLWRSGTSQLMPSVHCLVPGLKLHLLPAFLCYFNLIKIYAPSYTLLLSATLLQPANSILPLPLSFCEWKFCRSLGEKWTVYLRFSSESWRWVLDIVCWQIFKVLLDTYSVMFSFFWRVFAVCWKINQLY